MAVTAGSLSARVWRATESLPADRETNFERGMKRHAFKPVAIERGEQKAMGWTNVRQMLDSDVSMEKAVFGNVLALGLRVDRIPVNPRLFRARLAQETEKAMAKMSKGRMTDEQRTALEEKIKTEILKSTPPSIAFYEMAWRLDTGLIVFGSTGNALNLAFADLFAETFGVAIEPQFPYFRALRWSKRNRAERTLREILPAPFSPRAPREVVEVSYDDGDE